MTHNVYLYLLVMVIVTYAIRVLPLTLIRKPIRSRFIQSFLYYVPYVTNYLEDSRDIFGDHMDQLTIGQLGCVIGTHSGPGAIVVSFIPAE